MIWRCSLAIFVIQQAMGASVSASPATLEMRVRDLSDPDVTIRRSAAAALGENGDHGAVPALVKVIADPDASVRREAAKALGFIKDATALSALCGALADADVNVRYCAAYALGEIKDPGAIGALLKALVDTNWNVRTQAAWSLREIHDPSATAAAIAAIKDEAIDERLIGWLSKQGDVGDVLGRLTKLAEGADARTRLRLVKVLGMMGAPALHALAASLGDPDAGVKRTAMASLAEIGGEKVAAELRAYATREGDAALKAEACALVARLDPAPEPAARWSFDDGDPGHDMTGRGNDGKVTGCAPSEGKMGRCLDFGAKGCIELGKPTALPTANQPLTVMAWIKARGANGVIVARGGAFCGYSLYLKDGLPKFGMRRTADDAAPVIAAGKTPVSGDWTHVAGVIGQDRVELYVNGQCVSSEKIEGPLPGNCGQGMEIGFDAGNSAVEICDHFDGCIDEVKVFQRALEARHIAAEAGH